MDEFDYKLVKSLYEDKIITNVAKNLFVSQPALTKRLNKIEEEFGVPLFIRSKKGITFTESGLLVYEYCKRTLEFKEQLTRKIDNINKKHLTLKVGCTTAYALYELPTLISDFCKNHKNIEFIIEAQTSYQNYLELSSKSLNIAIIRDDFIWDGKKIKLCEEPVYFVYNKKIEYNNLSEIPLITYSTSPSLDNIMYRWLEENGISKDIAIIKANNAQTALKLVERGIGWSIMPLLYISNFDGYAEELFVDNQKYTRTTYLYYTTECEKDIISKEFIEFIKTYYNV